MNQVARQGIVQVNGTGLFVDERGAESAPPLLYIHGGPGQSCWDFMAAQGDRLAERLRVIGVDQRGVLRSENLPESPVLDVDVLIEDFEALRTELNIRSWTILGHSAGAGYALGYATREPRAVDAVLFDCPCWDGDLTDRYRLPLVADMLDAVGKTEAAATCRKMAQKPERITVEDEPWVTMQELGAQYMSIFFQQPDGPDEYRRIEGEGNFTEEQWEKGQSHAVLLAAMYQSQLHRLPQLSQPSLLLHGADDLVTPPAVIEIYRDQVPNGTVHTFDRSGHFAYHEEAKRYGDVVADFVIAHAR